jgi:hypothetical protein
MESVITIGCNAQIFIKSADPIDFADALAGLAKL